MVCLCSPRTAVVEIAVASGVPMTRAATTRYVSTAEAEVRAHFPEQTLRTVIPRNVRVSEAPSYGQTVVTYDARSVGAVAYRMAALEVSLRFPQYE